MSRSTRPLRRVRGDALAALEARAEVIDGWLVPRLRRQLPELLMRVHLDRLATRLRCRPAQLRRCLLGRPVSARAAGRILAS